MGHIAGCIRGRKVPNLPIVTTRTVTRYYMGGKGYATLYGVCLAVAKKQMYAELDLEATALMEGNRKEFGDDFAAAWQSIMLDKFSGRTRGAPDDPEAWVDTDRIIAAIRERAKLLLDEYKAQPSLFEVAA